MFFKDLKSENNGAYWTESAGDGDTAGEGSMMNDGEEDERGGRQGRGPGKTLNVGSVGEGRQDGAWAAGETKT